MPPLIKNGQSITPEHNNDEGNGGDSGDERYPRRRAEYSGEDSGE